MTLTVSNRKKGLRSRTTIVYLFAISTPFLLSTLLWIVCLAEQIVRMRTFFVERSERNTRNILGYATLFNALVLLNVGCSEPPYIR